MHLQMRMIQCLLMIPLMGMNNSDSIPDGFTRVYTARGNQVVTGRSSIVIAKTYV